MQIIDNKFDDRLNAKTFIALGSFDGLHLGHMCLIDRCMELAKQMKGLSMVYTFRNHPLTIINPEAAPKLILDNLTKMEMLESIGIDILCLVDFNEEVRHMSAEDFITHLLSKYNMGGVVVGFNYRFGYRNQGNVELLQKLSKKHGFSVTVINPLEYDMELVSSSRIRKLAEDGKISEANRMLFKPFRLRGKVITGKQLGRKLGYPTANILVDDKFVIPKPGVYYSNVRYRGSVYLGMTNIGYNPTVECTNRINIETYIFDFNEVIYGEELEVFFIERIRDEIKFSSLEELIGQMKKDDNYVKGKKIEVF
ncbi:MAG: bifunctional riboflavin kinase/FAD synthetase [Bacillota bacterium]|nr:bifunctional riboflavin kinase/FAD synthetase [Bacillota bacterium]